MIPLDMISVDGADTPADALLEGPGHSECGCHSVPWYVACAEPGRDRLLKASLRDLGFGAESFGVIEHVRLRGETRAVHRPLFPGYVFLGVRPGSAALGKVFSAKGAQGSGRAMLRDCQGRPARVPAGVMRTVFAECHQRAAEAVSLPGDLVGKALRVTSGPFFGAQGECLVSGPKRVELLLTLLGRPVQVRVARGAVEAVGA